VKEVGGAAMDRNKSKTQLNSLLKDKSSDVVSYMKSLSPSGVELEIMSLTNFDMDSQPLN